MEMMRRGVSGGAWAQMVTWRRKNDKARLPNFEFLILNFKLNKRPAFGLFLLFEDVQCTIPLMTFQNKPIPKTCGRCGKVFQCQTQEAHGGCWCDLYPPLKPVKDTHDCLCSDCLGKATLFPVQETLA
jgi:hypothetical protein